MTFTVEFWLQILIYSLSFGAMWGNFSARLHYLEQKMDKHNDLQSRMAVVEASTKSAHHRLDENKEDSKHA